MGESKAVVTAPGVRGAHTLTPRVAMQHLHAHVAKSHFLSVACLQYWSCLAVMGEL